MEYLDMMKDTLAIIDGDVVVYSCGFASDAAAKREGIEHEPLAYCLNGVKEMIKSVVTSAGCDDHIIVLSGATNHRLEVYPEYKANRDPSHRPYWYNEIKEYLENTLGAVKSDPGDEADDELGILHGEMPRNSVICTIDKDLDQVPGLHYNWSAKRKGMGVYVVSPEEADFTFYSQVLTGDSTDNIPGLFRSTGKKATAKIMQPMIDMTPLEMYNYVIEQYGGNVDLVNTIAHLVWIKRERGMPWLPPTE